MKLSEVLESELESAYNVIVDIVPEESSPLLREVGLLVSFDEDNEIDFDVLDAAIILAMSGTKVILELKASDQVDAAAFFLTAANLNVNASLLPPTEKTSESLQQYTERLSEVLKVWMSASHASSMAYPISGYFQYMVLEAYNAAPSTITDDEYIQRNFVDPFTLEELDSMKDKLRQVVFSHFGGEAGFREFVMSFGAQALDEMIDCAKAQQAS